MISEFVAIFHSFLPRGNFYCCNTNFWDMWNSEQSCIHFKHRALRKNMPKLQCTYSFIKRFIWTEYIGWFDHECSLHTLHQNKCIQFILLLPIFFYEACRASYVQKEFARYAFIIYFPVQLRGVQFRIFKMLVNQFQRNFCWDNQPSSFLLDRYSAFQYFTSLFYLLLRIFTLNFEIKLIFCFNNVVVMSKVSNEYRSENGKFSAEKLNIEHMLFSILLIKFSADRKKINNISGMESWG